MSDQSIKIPILSIAGSDCSGGAGLQADLKTFSAYELFGMSIVLSVVAENTARVIDCFHLPPSSVDQQFQAIFEDIPPKAVKIGMVGTCELMECLEENLKRFKPSNLVLDPVMFAKNGFSLMPIEHCSFLAKTLIPYADVLTPNLPEAEFLCQFEIKDEQSQKNACKALCDLGAKSVLLKGGHLKESADDLFFDGSEFHILRAKRVQTQNTHGTGCTLSSAIASNLALGKSLLESIQDAKNYVHGAILHSLDLGRGCGPLNHFYRREV